MATLTSRLALRQPAPTDLVSVVTDINDSMANIDGNIGFLSVTAFPNGAYAGKPVFRSDQTNRSYFYNGTAPSSGAANWVELLNSSGTFGSNVNLASASQVVIGADVNLFRNAANVLRTNDALIVDGTLTSTGAFTASAGVTVTGALSTTTNVTVGGDLKLINGTTIYRNKLSTAAVTVSNTAAETVIGSLTVPANDAVVGAIYRIIAWGVIGVASATTPTITFKGRIGGIGGSTFATTAKTSSSGVTNKVFRVEAYVVILATGGSGSWFGNLYLAETVSTTSTSANTSTDGSVAQTVSTTSSQDIVITATWGTANASNTLIRQGLDVERVA